MMRCLSIAALLFFAIPLSAQEEAKDEAKPEAKPKPSIYDEKADAKAVIAEACKKAAKENRRVLVQWGANWCGWCHILHDVFAKEPAVARLIRYEYDVVLVDVGKFDRNEELRKEYGAEIKGHGIPYLTILDADGKVVCNQPTEVLETPKEEGKENGYVIEKLTAFLKENAAKPLVAKDVVEKALAEAKSEEKIIFLHFGAPWCGWCHRLEDWMAQPEVADLLAKDFVDLKVDTDRMTGGQELLKEYCSEPGGIPWFVFLDAEGKPVADSGVGRKNLGFPFTDDEISGFAELLGKVKRNLSEDDVHALVESLKEFRERINAKKIASTAKE